MLLSIITINYNNREGLIKTIKSVISQTYTDYEYIIIDGGSDDGSKETIEDNRNYINYWVSEKDNGRYHAMNKGVAHSKGNYCIFLNSGDIFYDNQVVERIAAIKAEEDIIVGKVSIDKNNTILTPPPFGELTMYHLFSGGIPHQGAFIKIELLKKNPYDESLKIASDWKFFVQTLIFDNCSIRYLDEFIAKYDTKGISSTNPELTRKEKEEYLKLILPPRVLADYRQMKASECKTQTLTTLLRKNYSIDKFLFSIGKFLLKIKGEIKEDYGV